MKNRSTARRSPKKSPLGPSQTFVIDGLTHEAKGVARSQGKVVFVEGALPGETVTAQITKFGRRFDEAKLTEVLQESDSRVTPACEHFHSCGGCSFQHLTNSSQLSAKSDWLKGQMRRVFPQGLLESLTDTPLEYRRRARISVDHKSQALKLGFREKNSNSIISIDQCLVLTRGLQAIFSSLKQELQGSELIKSLGHIELLEDTKGVSVLLRLTEDVVDPVKENLGKWAQDEQVHLYWQAPKESKASVAREHMRHYDLDGLRLYYHPQDFIQVNAPMNEKMVAQALGWLQPNQNDVILDLFCGVGNFSLPLAKRAKSVVGVEVQDSMVQAAQYNADINKLTNLSFVAADLSKPVSKKLSAEKVTKVLLDPPRSGAYEFLQSIIKLKPKQILYVSCSASTLARDAEYLVENGYKVLRVGLMDMFPQTSHVETMMLLQKSSKSKGK
ncbi:23S rRNA (uracil(1939)-C(5))-methyltransferase RlmD [Marinomonas sp. C2222]|uniref:23S rRNA (uracil(1939)-C(5))-methyltransferase RlmD n=1 Tax=Marinomonas sargassi TaxID=2984494 RepID=A0ABT2YVC3_9GAMM|nr:23S rRNA (uracil(1939)-C(5))-methyltransferase RlmD [Marinomonas sargassi]MCV2403834.1 23S rRNA (uracil(1939)-C(5))-methyltransferase RlmD [Marinomonas sargassi]